MMVAGSLAKTLLALFCGAMFGAAAWTAYLEARPYFATRPPVSAFDGLNEGGLVPGPSIASAQVVLDECLEALTSTRGRTQPSADRRNVLAICSAHAEAIVAASPSYSYAWFLLALAAGSRDDIAGLNQALRMSQVTGPTEQWIAELRVGLAEQHFNGLEPAVAALHERDLALLVTSRRGIWSIAQRYVREAGFRERITAIVETLPEKDQGRFVTDVRNAVGSVGRAPS